MPDSFELAYNGLNGLIASDAFVDKDLDGYDNLAE